MRTLSSLTLAVGLATAVLTSGCGGGTTPTPTADLAPQPDLAVVPDMAVAKPAAPSNLKAVPLGGCAHVPWKDNSSDEDGFMLMRKEGAGAWTDIATVPFNTTAYHDAPLKAATTYTYMVHAKKGDVLSDPSNEAMVTTP